MDPICVEVSANSNRSFGKAAIGLDGDYHVLSSFEDESGTADSSVLARFNVRSTTVIAKAVSNFSTSDVEETLDGGAGFRSLQVGWNKSKPNGQNIKLPLSECGRSGAGARSVSTKSTALCTM